MSGDATGETVHRLVGHDVWLACPKCSWRSTVMVVGGAVNAAWRCYADLGYEYRRHADERHGHPAPTRMHSEPSGSNGESQ